MEDLLLTDSATGLQYELIIGIETHVQVLSRTKAFCGCENSYGGIPNSRTCPTCLALPGAHPRVNKRLFEAAILTGLAFNSKIAEKTGFVRKNYSYPDLTKGYQISQGSPVAVGGSIAVESEGRRKNIDLVGLHMEEDVGKTLRIDGTEEIYLDYNRSGAPLLEIVSQPVIYSVNEAVAYAAALREIVRYLGVSTGDMEEGSLRCDANINLRIHKDNCVYVTPIAEIKNMNSFRAIKKALEFEIQRQLEAWLENSITIDSPEGIKMTRRWDEESGQTLFMRYKGVLDDYRFCPEPDLKVTTIPQSWVDELKGRVGELPLALRDRLKGEYGLTDFDAETLTAQRELAAYYEEALKNTKNPKRLANWVLTELLGALKPLNKDITASPVSAESMAALVNAIEDNLINGKQAKDVFEAMIATGKAPAVLIKELGLEQIADNTLIDALIDEVLAENPKAIADYKAGKDHALKFLMGMAMKKSKGKINPGAASELIVKKLNQMA
jgi:aspartyl-tRNA(Asn)/glutamyl-tRNA(Gln) amidotransferase subunit B